MLYITGNIFDISSWSYQPNTPAIALGITTNGMVKTNGHAVMGAGVAKGFVQRYPQLPVILGHRLLEGGNQVHYLLAQGNTYLFSFPTKHHWHEPSDLTLIVNSATTLANWAKRSNQCTFVLPTPGCGLGGLDWNMVTQAIAPLLPDNCWIVNYPHPLR